MKIRMPSKKKTFKKSKCNKDGKEYKPWNNQEDFRNWNLCKLKYSIWNSINPGL